MSNGTKLAFVQKAALEKRLTVCCFLSTYVGFFSAFFNFFQLTAVDDVILPAAGSSFDVQLRSHHATRPHQPPATALVGQPPSNPLNQLTTLLGQKRALLCTKRGAHSEDVVEQSTLACGGI